MNSKERAERNEKIMSIYNEMHAEGYKTCKILQVIGEKVGKISWGTLCNIRKNYEKNKTTKIKPVLGLILTCLLCGGILVGLLLISAEFAPSASFLDVVTVYAVGWLLILGCGGACYALFKCSDLLENYTYEDPTL